MLVNDRMPDGNLHDSNLSWDNGSKRRGLRESIAGLLYHSGAIGVLQTAFRHYEFSRRSSWKMPLLRRTEHAKHVILCYHRIGTGGIPLFNGLPPKAFAEQIQFVARRYHVISLDELCDRMEKPSTGERTVTITFDDGYRDLFTHALPVLERFRIPATVFVPVSCIESGEVPWYDRVFVAIDVFPGTSLELQLDRPRTFRLASKEARLQAATEIVGYLRTLPDRHRKEFCEGLEARVRMPSDELKDRMLTWEQIGIMCQAGIYFESHTMTHAVISRLTERQLKDELCNSKLILAQHTGKEVRHFAFPFGQPGDCGTQAQPLLSRLGYRSACTTVEGINTPGDDLLGLRRTQICNEQSLAVFAMKLSQLLLTSSERSANGTSARQAAGRESVQSS